MSSSFPDGVPQGTAAVVVTFNSGQTLHRCLSNLARELSESDELIVVDNGSADSSVPIAFAHPAKKAVVALPANRGYTAAANLGIRLSRAKSVLLVNPDAFLSPGVLRKMARALEQESVAAVGPVSNYVAGAQFVGSYLPLEFKGSVEEMAAFMAASQRGITAETKLLIGFCVLIRRDVLERIGLLDEDLFLGSDDLEFSWRARVNGYRLLIATDCFVEHIGGTSFGRSNPDEVRALLADSTAALRKKLESHYGQGLVPSSEELWGCDIFRG